MYPLAIYGCRMLLNSQKLISFFKAGLTRRKLGVSCVSLCVLVVFSISSLIAHHTVMPTDRDESRFAQASKQMAATGDLVVVRFQNELRAKKPAGIYWLQSASAKIFSHTNISSYRLPSLIAGLGTLILIYQFAPSFGLTRGLGQAQATGLVLATLIFNTEILIAKTDSALLFFCTAMQICLWHVYKMRHSQMQRFYAYGFWCALGFSCLIKGPIGLLLATTTIATLCLWDRHINWLRKLLPFTGSVMFMLIAMPWYILVTLQTDGEFLKKAFFEDFAAKIISGQESHGAPPGFYLLTLMFLFFPASLYFRHLWHGFKETINADNGKFLVSWIAGFWLMFELMPTKLPHYVLPTFPALAILCALGLDKLDTQTTSGKKPYIWAGFSAMIILIFLACLYALINVMSELNRLQALIWLGVAILALIVCSQAALVNYPQKRGRYFAQFVLASIIFYVSVFVGVSSNLDRITLSPRITDDVVKIVKSRNIQNPNIYANGYTEPSLIFLLDGINNQSVRVLSAKEIARHFAADDTPIALIEKKHLATFLSSLPNKASETKIITSQKGFNYSRGTNVEIFIITKKENKNDTKERSQIKDM